MKSLIQAIIPLCCLTVGAFAEKPEVNLLTGEGISLGEIIFPAVNFQSAFGTSDAEPSELLSGHHDPDRKGITVQDIEFSLSAKLGERVTLIGIYAAKIDTDDRWQGAFEEYFATVSGLPFGATLKGGQLRTHFGFHNQNHPHAFTMIDQNIASGRILGEDGIAVIGVELSLPILRTLPSGWDDHFTLSVGKVPQSDEDEHHHREEEEHDEPTFEPKGGLFTDWVATAHYGLTFAATSSTTHSAGISGAWGENDYGRSTQIYGASYEYRWQESAKNSAFVTWRTEAFARKFGAVGHDDVNERKDITDFAAYSVLTYVFEGGKWQAHLRGDYASGTAEAGLPEWWRISPAVTWTPSNELPMNWKLQYNYENSPSFGEAHSVWLQLNLRWGRGCADAH